MSDSFVALLLGAARLLVNPDLPRRTALTLAMSYVRAALLMRDEQQRNEHV